MESHLGQGLENAKTSLQREHVGIPSSIRIFPPVSGELFFAGKGESTLSPVIVDNPRLLEQSGKRATLHSLFNSIFEEVPDPRMEIGEAVQSGLVSPNTVVDLWKGLADFFEQDSNNFRILLYLPFEVLPNFNEQLYESNELRSAGRQLGELYWEGWIRLLHETESRANFTDGDILEPGLGDPEKVSKAGHLTPELLARGIITQHDVANLLGVMSDAVSIRSLAEGATLAHEKGLIDEDEWNRIEEIIRVKVGDLTRIPKEQLDFNNPDSERISSGRARWLRKVEQSKVDDSLSHEFASKIVDAGMEIEEAIDRNGPGRVAALSIVKAGMQLAQGESTRLGDFLEKSSSLLIQMWESGEPAVKDAIVGGLHQWVRLGIIEKDFLQQFGIRFVDLSLPSQFDEKEAREDFGYLISAAEKLKEHKELSQFVYPGFLLFGSRVKGYADFGSDLDAAIFFKPEAQFEQREHMLKVLKEDIPELTDTSLLEFWSSEDKGKIKFKIPQENTRIFVGEEQVHFLMGGVWIGDGEELTQVRNDMLLQYLDLSHHGDREEEARRLLLGLLELDAVQYRLLHRGYKKLYPENKEEGSSDSDLIDGESTFWDPGYRRVATKLFLSKVFLPDLS